MVVNLLAAGELVGAALTDESARSLVIDGELLWSLFSKYGLSGAPSVAGIAKMSKTDMVSALKAVGRQAAELAKIIETTQYGYEDAVEVLTSLE